MENSLNNAERVRAAALDALLIVPFIAIGFGLPPLLGWIADDKAAGRHAYHFAGIVLAVIIGGGVVAWNLLVRDVTLGTSVVLNLKKKAP